MTTAPTVPVPHPDDGSPLAPRCPSRDRRLDECSRCAVRTMLALGLGGRDAGSLLAGLGEAAAATGLRDSAVLDRLVEAVRHDRRAEERVRGVLEDRLEPRAARYRACSLAELARLWSQDRHRLEGEELLALLWVVLSRSEPACRSFEQRLVEEISVLALQSLAATRAARSSEPETTRGRATASCGGAAAEEHQP